MKTRQKVKSRRGGEIERFAKLPVEEVLQAEAVTTLNHAAFRVLVIIAGQCWYDRFNPKGNNGTAALTESFALRFGFRGRDTLYSSLRELTERGLTVVTREGLRLKNRFTLYGVGWLPVTHVNGQPLDTHIAATAVPVPRCLEHLGYIPDFREWKASASIPKAGSVGAGMDPDSRECTLPTAGNGRTEYVPIIGNREAKYVPTIGNTLDSRGDPKDAQGNSGSGEQ